MSTTPPLRRSPMPLHWKILIGLVAGLAVGLAINALWTAGTWSGLGVQDARAFLAASDNTGAAEGGADVLAHAARFVRRANEFVGRFFMRGLQFIAVPIVLFSLIVGGASLGDVRKLGRIGGKTVVLYMLTTAIAVTIGLVLAHVIQPGENLPEEAREMLAARGAAEASAKQGMAERAPSVWAFLLNIVPANPFAALAAGDMLAVVITGLFIGLALTAVPKAKADAVIAFCDGMTEAIIRVVHAVLVLAPVAVFALIASVAADLGPDVLAALAKYGLTVVAGLAAMVFIVYPAMLKLFTPVKITRFFKAISPAQLLAFSSSSSGATMPVTMECCEHRLGLREDVVSFIIPLGATINMDGTALYQGVAAAFIVQLLPGVDLTFADNLTIVFTATLASVGTAAVPSAGVVMLVIVLQQLGLTDDQIGLGIAVILGIDRVLDMCRTTVNVTSDCVVATIVAAGEKAIGPEGVMGNGQ